MVRLGVVLTGTPQSLVYPVPLLSYQLRKPLANELVHLFFLLFCGSLFLQLLLLNEILYATNRQNAKKMAAA